MHVNLSHWCLNCFVFGLGVFKVDLIPFKMSLVVFDSIFPNRYEFTDKGGKGCQEDSIVETKDMQNGMVNLDICKLFSKAGNFGWRRRGSYLEMSEKQSKEDLGESCSVHYEISAGQYLSISLTYWPTNPSGICKVSSNSLLIKIIGPNQELFP